MKVYVIRWRSTVNTESGVDLIKTELSYKDVFDYYYREQFWLDILSIDEAVEYFGTLTKSSDGEFLLDGEK